MSNHGKCPKCGLTVSEVSVERVTVGGGPSQPRWHGVSYLCPSCSTVLSVQLDPLLLRDETVTLLRDALRD